jgi:hypothetical protein
LRELVDLTAIDRAIEIRRVNPAAHASRVAGYAQLRASGVDPL